MKKKDILRLGATLVLLVVVFLTSYLAGTQQLLEKKAVELKVASEPPWLGFTVRFQGIDRGRRESSEQMSQAVGVRIEDGQGRAYDLGQVGLDYDPGTGFYSPAALIPLLGVPTGGGYTIYIKGQKHLEKRFCADGQKEDCFQGQGALVLAAENIFAFQGVTLAAGDLPNPGLDFEQDGVVNSIDVEILMSLYCQKEAILGRPACIDQSLEVGDLDLDGRVSDSDLQLIQQTLAAGQD